jgi:hypothetical protein
MLFPSDTELRTIGAYTRSKGFNPYYKNIVEKLRNGFNLRNFYVDWINFICIFMVPGSFIWSMIMFSIGLAKDTKCWQCYSENTFLWVFYGIEIGCCCVALIQCDMRYRQLSILEYFKRTCLNIFPFYTFIMNFIVGLVVHAVYLSKSDYFFEGNIVGIIVNIMLMVISVWTDEGLRKLYESDKYYDRPPPYSVEIQPPQYSTCTVSSN